MPLDALCLTAVAAELRAAVAGGKIDKLYQPTRDEVVLYVRGQGENVRLLLSANPGHPRANLTTLNRENPEQPPMFCMLLRKHLQGARILELNQPPLERILEFRLETLDELGDRVERRLVLEAMGRSANLLLLDGEGRIIDCIRRVDGDLGRGQRQLLPGLFYRQPPAPDKLNPFTIEPEELRLVLENPLGKEWDKLLLDSFTGLSPLVARELAFRAGGDRERLAAELEKLKNNVNENGLTPYLLVREGKPVDLTAKEFDLMELLLRNPGRVYSRENLLNVVWGYEYAGDYRTVDVHVRRLREKLELDPANPEYILTKWGVGYYLKHG